MASFSTFLGSIYRDGNDGKQFERFVKWFLKNDPVWSKQVDKVWMWNEYPDKWGNHKDLGTDLIFKTYNDELWAVQAKCFDEKTSITKAHVEAFLSDSDQPSITGRLFIASKNKISENANERLRRSAKSGKPVTCFMRSDFEKADVSYPKDYKDLRSVKKLTKPSPTGKYKYQDAAVKDVVKGFKKADRGQLLMACGTGKTFTTLWIKERLKSQITLVLVPSLNLLSQTLREWCLASKSNFQWMCVCSDKTVSTRRDDDEIIQSVLDTAVPVSSDVDQIAKFLRKKGDRVIFCTYQSSPLISQAQRRQRVPGFDLVIADEAHRCVITGDDERPFTTVLNGKRIRAKMRLFATATPRTYSAGIKTKAENRGVEMFDMNDKKLFGTPFHELSFGDAINHKPPLLTDYQVIVMGVDDAMVASGIKNRALVKTKSGKLETDAETLAAQVGLLKAIQKYDLKSLITFHGRVARAKYFAEDLEAAGEIINKRYLPKEPIWADYVEGKMSTSDRAEKLERLRLSGTKRIGVLSNARCLGEGVDVPALDGIAFVDPKNSEIDIIQAVGRAIRLNKNKQIGSIVLPVFIGNGEDLETKVDKSNFKPIWTVLNALKAHDATLGVELDELRTQMGRRGRRNASPGKFSKIVFDLPETVTADFANSLKTYLVEQTTATWNFWFGLLERYVEEFSHAHPQVTYETPDGFRLGPWVHPERNRCVDPERRRRLEALPGWTWDKNEFDWEVGFQHLDDYVKEYGNARPPIKVGGKSYITSDGYTLGRWVDKQRGKGKDSRLTPKQRKRLEALTGWVWDETGTLWEEGFQHLEDYVKEYGNAHPVEDYTTSSDYPLGRWVGKQRQKKKSLTPKQRKRLGALPGWAWNKNEFDWEVGFQHLDVYVKEFGHAHPNREYKSPDSPNEYPLGKWVQKQRTNKRINKLTPKQEKRLEALVGWLWNKRDVDAKVAWELGFQHLEKYVKENGHACPPIRVGDEFYTIDGYTLGAWINKQRTRKDTMDPELKRRLEALPGWLWKVKSKRSALPT